MERLKINYVNLKTDIFSVRINDEDNTILIFSWYDIFEIMKDLNLITVWVKQVKK